MNLKDHIRAGARQRARLIAAGAAGTAGLALLPGPAALAALASMTAVGCSANALAAAVSGAPNGAVLTLAPQCRYVLSSDLEAAVSLTIRGNGGTITAGGSGFLILLVDTGATVRLDGLTLSNGSPAILNAGTLTVTGSAFTGNIGAIGNTGTLTVKDSEFTGNTIIPAIGNGGTLTVTGSTFTRNTGTAISSEGRVSQASITVTDSTFSGNSSSVAGGAISITNTLGTLKGDRFTDNTAAATYGGAVENTCRNGGSDEQCALTITGSTFSENTATGGGAIASFAALTVTDSTLTRNVATDPIDGYGGGLDNSETATLTNTLITGNKAHVDGGGIYNLPGGSVALTGTQVRSNTPDNCAPTGTIAGCAS